MELLLEVLMYLLVVLGIITVCCTFFGKINMLDMMNVKDNICEKCQNKCYKRSKKDGEKITVIIKYQNISEEEIENVKNAIKTGTYVEISDVVDKVKYVKVDKK